MGAWFVAYITHHEGEQAVIDFWINTQNGIQFPENFERTFGEDYRTYVAEFEDFIAPTTEKPSWEYSPVLIGITTSPLRG